MKTLKKIASVLVIVLVAVSCTNDLEEINVVSNDTTHNYQVTSRSNSNCLKIVYHGMTYESIYTIAEDSIYLYQNPKVENLIAELNTNKPNLMTFFHVDGTIEYFDNEADFELNKDRLMAEHEMEKKALQKLSSKRWPPVDNKPYLSPADPGNNEVEIHLYEDELYWGDYFALARSKHDSDYIQSQKVWNFGGDITSMIVHTIGVGGIFTFYDVMDCQGKSFTMIIQVNDRISLPFSNYETGAPKSTSYGSLFMMDLRDVYWSGSSANWSDRICCIKVRRYVSGGSGGNFE